MRFAVARYYFDSLFREQANESFIDDLLNKSPMLEGETFSYVIGDIEVEEYEGFNFVRGTLGRLRSNEAIDVYDKKERTFKKQNLDEVADKLIEFMIEPSTHLIFIQDDFGFTRRTVVHKLMSIYNNVSEIANLKIDFVIQEKDVYKALRSWDRVKKIQFSDLRPTNPSSKDNFKEIEDLLKETGSARTDITFHAQQKKDDESEEGLNYDSKLIRQPLALAANGYGNAKLIGVEGDKQVQVQTSKFVRKVEVDFGEDGALKRIVQEVREIQADVNVEEPQAD